MRYTLAECVVIWLLACVQTPAHAPLTEPWTREVLRREELRRNGLWCRYEVETLAWRGEGIWPGSLGEGAPVGQNWCTEDGESATWFDVVAEDGAFVSTILRTDRIGISTAMCVTWNIEHRRRATLVEYDERHAERRWQKAQLAVPTGYTLNIDEWVVTPGGHVAFCARPEGGASVATDLHWVHVK